jgi:hypothetical protein
MKSQMALFGLLGRKEKGYASPWLQLTVLYAMSAEGLAPENAFAIRGKVLLSKPLQFEFINTGAFLAFYPGTAAGLHAASELADLLRTYAREKSVPAFGVSVQQGECLAQMNATGRLTAKPVGEIISQTMNLATQEATAQAG